MRNHKDPEITFLDRLALRFLVMVFQAAIWINKKTGIEVTIEI